MDETYIKVRGRWMYLYRAIDSVGDAVEFFFSENRDLPAAKCFLRKALERHGKPERIVIDGSQTNHEAIISCDAENRLRDGSRRSLKPIRIRTSKYLNNRIEQDHRRIKRGKHRGHSFRYRDGSHDAQTTGEVCLQSTSLNRRAVRDPCCLNDSAEASPCDYSQHLRQNQWPLSPAFQRSQESVSELFED